MATHAPATHAFNTTGHVCCLVLFVNSIYYFYLGPVFIAATNLQMLATRQALERVQHRLDSLQQNKGRDIPSLQLICSPNPGCLDVKVPVCKTKVSQQQQRD